MTWLDELVEHYRGGDLVDVFGLVLYTDSHANIKKVLMDNDYWTAFDVESGVNWLVFSIRALPGHFSEVRSPPGVFSHMISVWKEPKDNIDLLERLELDSTKELPLLVVFAPGSGDGLLQHRLKLMDSSVDDAYASLKEAIRLVTMAIDSVPCEQRYEGLRAFEAVTKAISLHKGWAYIKKAAKIYEFFRSISPI